MPIQEQNIKFIASQVMDDVPEGGGAATSHEIPDGVMNNVFEDISDLDRAMGRFNLRKLFLAVRTLSTDLFGGAKTVVTALPEDPAIGYTLFTTNDPFDTRADAADRVEAYLYKGPSWPGALYENHIEGMRQISVLQRVGTPLPPRGKTLCLVQAEGSPQEIEQYVRVIDVSAELREFNVATSEAGKVGDSFERLVVTMSLSDALRHDFNGHSPLPADNYNYTSGTRIRDTTVADATRYFGAQYLATTAEIGDRTLRADSMFTQLVPAAQSEEPLANQTLNPDQVQIVSGGAREVEVAQQAHTLARQVTAENRRMNWIETLSPVPGPGAFSVAFMSQGNWYTLTDDGSGVIAGSDPGFGTGTLDYQTGNATLTLGALPDAGSQIIYTYGSRVHYEVRSGATAINEPGVKIPIALGNTPAATETLTASWPSGGVTKIATCSASGQFSGDATGEVDPVTGIGYLMLGVLPDRGGTLSLDYDFNKAVTPTEEVTKTESLAAGSTITLSAAPAPGTLRLVLPMADSLSNFTVVARDVGGQLVVPAQKTSNNNYKVAADQTIGTVSGNTININTMDVQLTRHEWMGSLWASASA